MVGRREAFSLDPPYDCVRRRARRTAEKREEGLALPCQAMSQAVP